ncbi:phosphonoacetate hydrolase [Bradyrhizobium sp. AUGA SZCCT0169]|uniref:phosphonoacetate hydrolase n=1 Tax=Bradyrhizobium sp. AUGA SZCCT0169 TaxID=2807663 RepID=UPI001BAC8367|nr:phosphonoacetate hydrolase [Bradyrhizobium sp. AUGA SZCCT0169]MBR1248398.1 phosphonoacetate hydrolase [Bradyrhizobium sp. AUGA SZCCT0169]
MLTRTPASVTTNGRSYRLPNTPTVVICIDGSEPGYIERAIEKGLCPNLDRILKTGTNTLALSVIPSFTNPNNLSIITGRPPAVHGIAGNFFYDRETKQEVMMNDARFLRAPTILADFQKAGSKVAMVTAKDKLRTLLGKGLDFQKGTAIAFSSEKADKADMAENGIDNVLEFVGMKLPEVYSADLSEFVFAAGVKLLKTFRPDVMYLSTTDYVQHKAAPGSAIADSFYKMFDRYVGELDALGCVLVMTADHGMNDKHLPNGQPDVIYLQEILDEKFGSGMTRVILPITDPYVAHHGALGSFATVYVDADKRQAVLDHIKTIEGVEVAIPAEEACKRFELPADRIGDVVVLSSKHKVLGTSAAKHDLSGLTEPLRSHGGLTEQTVPMIANRKIKIPAGRTLRNFDVFDVALNLVS